MNRSLAQRFAPVALPVIVLLAALVFERGFFNPANLQNVTRQASFLLIVALGQLIIIIGRGLDLSVGAVITTTLLLLVQIAGRPGGSIVVALLAVVAAGFVIGTLNGLMVGFRKVPAILATLAMFVLVQGVAIWVTEGRSKGRVPEIIKPLGVGKVGPIPIPVIIAVIVAVACGILIQRSSYGRRLFAVGANPDASQLSGISVRTIQASTFVLGSLLAVLAGLLLSGFVGFYDRTLGTGYDLDSIIAVILGGASFAGGRGTVWGTAVAVLGLAALDNLLVLLGVDVSVKLILKAAVLFLAVASAGWIESTAFWTTGWKGKRPLASTTKGI